MAELDLMELRDVVDEQLEMALVRRASVGELMGSLLPLIAARLGAESLWLRTYAEDLELHEFSHGPALPGLDGLRLRTGEDQRQAFDDDAGAAGRLYAQPLDVVGTWFGALAFSCKGSGQSAERLRAARNLVCEILDNFLFSIRAAREKHAITMELGNALRHRVLSQGLNQAVAVLERSIPIYRLLLVFVTEESSKRTLGVQFYENGKLQFDTLVETDADRERFNEIRRMASGHLSGQSDALLTHVGMKGAQEELLINGITNSVVVGKIVVTSDRGTFNTYDRELLSSFAGFIRQRIVDFNKEWRNLAASFSPDTVARLLTIDDYTGKYLAPRESEVAILYVDIAGFTRLSEQVLRTPARVAELVEAWSRDAVDIVWRHGGVFDKMVGDCIIALFGPPFYDTAPEDRLAAAIECAVDIREMTGKLSERPQFSALAGEEVGVATGIHLAPLFVGTFGPNENFTGFSSGMNNTARLQGCATKGEILVMAEAIARLPKGNKFTFGDERTAQVKNVADPLRFRLLQSR
jgi:adenylate cyclase